MCTLMVHSHCHKNKQKGKDNKNNKNMKKYLCILCLAMIASCNKQNNSALRRQLDSVTVNLPTNILQNAKVINDAKQILAFNKDVEHIWIISDTLCVANRPAASFSVYDLRDTAIRRDILKYGDRDSCFLSSIVSISNGYFVIYDYVKNLIFTIPISKLKDPGSVPQERHWEVSTQQASLYGGDTLIGINPNCFDNEKLGIHKDANRFIFSDKVKSNKQLKSKINTYNAVHGSFICNKDKDRLAYFDLDAPLAEFYDYACRPIKVVKGLADYPFSYEIVVRNKKKEACLSDYLPYAYTRICYNDSYIYALFCGKSFADNKDYSKAERYVVKYDWNGNLVSAFRINAPVQDISCSEKNDLIYYSVKENGMLKVYKYELH